MIADPKTPGPRLMDRLFGFFGVPSATKHQTAIVKSKVSVIIEMEVADSSKALTDALKQLSQTLDAGPH